MKKNKNHKQHFLLGGLVGGLLLSTSVLGKAFNAQVVIQAAESSSIMTFSKPYTVTATNTESNSAFEETTIPEIPQPNNGNSESIIDNDTNTENNTNIENNTNTENNMNTTETSPQVDSENTSISSDVRETEEIGTTDESQSKKPATTQSSEKEEAEIKVVYSQTTADFLKKVATQAQEVASRYDLYASVMIAQSILESASGNSSLSREPNYNLFGIKGDYKGASASFTTHEDDGNGNWYSIKAAFRKYPSYKESLEDYAQLLQSGFYAGARKAQAKTYKDATKYLTGRYATDTVYNKKLNALIETYQLTKYDGAPKAEIEQKMIVKEMDQQVSELKEGPHYLSLSVQVNSNPVQKEKITAHTRVEDVSATQDPNLVSAW